MAASTAAAIAEVQSALHDMRATILRDATMASTLPSTGGVHQRARDGAPLALTAGTGSLRTAGTVTRSGVSSLLLSYLLCTISGDILVEHNAHALLDCLETSLSS